MTLVLMEKHSRLLTTQLSLHRMKKLNWYNATDMLVDLKKEPSGRFHNFCQMDATDFESLLSRIAQTLIKKDTNMQKSIPAQERLAVALRFFASGDSCGSLSFLFKISKQTVSKCVDEVCKALIEELKDEIQLPKEEHQWLEIARQFELQWNFPNCLGR
ncbi:protein ANTAGONIST OF LIKE HETEROCHROMATIN PROTEIN 1-like isoform X2 [Nilaparvata lugens]|uniref:protein ANTAGONIST OF LIKE HETEROCHROMATIN PROTEIN 1-like isoform X2 n=1 Tax=Nilaparvata lugens TaxID=108931 RepID=UPI00193E70FB|nr:protein ANTAGONIST OF LIKE HETEROCHROMATIN PROTEIN 1-like isoform X2 [Nilaparvata lugens]